MGTEVQGAKLTKPLTAVKQLSMHVKRLVTFQEALSECCIKLRTKHSLESVHYLYSAFFTINRIK